MNSTLNLIATNLRKIRKKCNLRQYDLENYGINLRRYQEIEAGKANITIKTLENLSNIFNTPVVEFFNSDICKTDNITTKQGDINIYQEIINLMPYGVMIWKLKDQDDPKSFYLEGYNSKAELFTKPLKDRLNQLLIDVFSSAEEQGLNLLFYDVIKSGNNRRNKNLCYADKDMRLTVYNIHYVKLSDDTMFTVFENISDKNCNECISGII